VNFTSIALKTLDQNLFDRSIRAIDEQFAAQPLVKAQLLQSVGSALRSVGLIERAADPLRRALAIQRAELGEADARTLDSMSRLGVVLRDQGKLDEAEGFLSRALEGFQRLDGDASVESLNVTFEMGILREDQGRFPEAETYLRDALQGLRSHLGNAHERTLDA